MKIGQVSFQRLSSPVEVGVRRRPASAHVPRPDRSDRQPLPRRLRADPRQPPVSEPAVRDRGGRVAIAGGVSVRVVRAGWFRPDAGGFFGVVPKPLWSRLVETDDRGRLLCRLNLLLVEPAASASCSRPGTGVHMSDKDRDIKGVEGGDPVEALRAVGEDPATIDFVVVSHLHYDHAGGMIDADGRPNVPERPLRRPARRVGGGPRRRAPRPGNHGGRAARRRSAPRDSSRR
jgi:hypothetical protein